MLVPTSFNKSQDLLTGLPETPFIQAHFSIRIDWVGTQNFPFLMGLVKEGYVILG